MKINYGLSAYPLSRSFQTQLEEQAGEPLQFFLLSDFRQKKPLAMLKFLRQLQPNKFFLVLEDKNSQVLLPILQVIAKIAGPQQLIVVYSDLQCQPITVTDIARSLFKLMRATFFIHLCYLQACRKMRSVLKEPLISQHNPLKKAKKLLYLNANLWFGIKAGGSVGHIAGVVNALVQKSLKVDYAAVDASSLLAPSVKYLPLSVSDAFGLPSELNYYHFNAQVIKQLTALGGQGKWDFIYQRMSIANFSGAMLARHWNIPLILEYNGSEAWVAKNWGRGLRYPEAAVQAEVVSLEQAHTVVTISEALKEELITRGVRSEKIVCYPNCIDPVLFNPARFSEEQHVCLRAKYGIPGDAVVCTFVGTFGQWHGVDILANAIRSFFNDKETWLATHKVYFLLVGDGAKMAEVKIILAPDLNRPNLCLTGLIPQAEAPAFLAASDILLSPHVPNKDGSRFFGSPTKLFEYMAMGKAIIASELEQIGDVLKHSLHAAQLPVSSPCATNTELSVLCEPGNIQQLITALIFLVENKPWREQLGHCAREEALSKYTWAKHVEAFLG